MLNFFFNLETFFLVLVSFIRRVSLLEHQTNLGYAINSILPPAVLTCPYPLPGGYVRKQEGLPLKAVGKWFQGPCPDGLFLFPEERVGGLWNPKYTPKAFSGWAGFSTGAAGAVLGDFVSWWSFWRVESALVCCTWQSETADLEPTVKRAIFGLPIVTHAVSSTFLSKKFAQVYTHCTKFRKFN